MQFLLINQFTLYDHREGSATTQSISMFFTVTVYQEIIAMVKKEFPKLQTELNNVNIGLILLYTIS